MPHRVDQRLLGYVVVGGALGALARASLIAPIADAELVPWVTLGVNVTGALLLGVVVGALGDRHPHARAFLGAGMLGGFTTYSALAVQTALWLDDPWRAAGLAAASVLAGVVGAMAGLLTGRALSRRPASVQEDAE
jgi:CrcB protein